MIGSSVIAARRPRAINLFQPKVVHSTSALLDETTVVENPLAWTEQDTLRLRRAAGDRSWERIATCTSSSPPSWRSSSRSPAEMIEIFTAGERKTRKAVR